MALAAAACDDRTILQSAPLGSGAQALKLDPSFENSSDPTDTAQPAGDYTLFEADPVRPVAILEESGLVAVANGVDDYLELVRVGPHGKLSVCGGTRVGLRPVAVAVVAETRSAAELWVVNHLSDSLSIVDVDTEQCSATLVDTLYVGDEPRDIVVAASRRGGDKSVFVTAAHRGQHHPVESARTGRDLTTPPAEKQQPGLADVFVFEARGRKLRGVVNLFTEVPRALAVGDGVVYAAGFHTGNRTTSIMAESVLSRGLLSLEPLLARQGQRFIERSGELVLADGVAGSARIEGGMPAVVGRGRCVPDPRDDHADRFLSQVCVQTDAENRVERVLIEESGVVHDECQCTSGDGTLQPTTSVIVKFYESAADCGVDLRTFPDGSRGCWLDAAPGGVHTPAARNAEQPAPMSWNDEVRFSLPDRDVFAISVGSLEVQRALSGVGTIVYGLAVQPGTGRVFAANTEAENLTRFEGRGDAASTTVRGHLHESRITLIDGRSVTPVHLNDHIDYGTCCERDPEENAQSLALPTSLAFSEDGKSLYFTALGSDKVGIVDAQRLGRQFHNTLARSRGWLTDVQVGASEGEPAGPVGLALDARRGTLYVKTHFTNELVAIDPVRGEVRARVAFESPEPSSITRGRPVLYDARQTSAHGDSSCASCHVFGNFDGLAWDLGDPDAPSAKNPGPFAQPPALFGLAGIVRDPFSTQIVGRQIVEEFRSNKGPMTTQTLRGLANHGAQHWRGDRTRRFQEVAGAHPNFGSLDEDNSFNEFDVAIVGLNGNDRQLSASVFQDFTNFALQLTLPPNPVRALDDSLSTGQRRARATYFGCASMSDEQAEAGECVALDGALVDIDAETRACLCERNPLIDMLRDLPQVVAFFGELAPILADGRERALIVRPLTEVPSLPAERQAELERIAVALEAAFEALGSADLRLDARSLLGAPASSAMNATSESLSALRSFSDAQNLDLERRLLDALLLAISETPEGTPITSVGALQSGLRLGAEVSRVNAAVLADDAARGTGAFRDLLTGCEVSSASTCRMRVTDTLATCHGCHTLDPRGNEEFDVYRPGFFGTSGRYSFEAFSQLFKIPHLRNAYTKAGMFGVAPNFLFVQSSVLGDRRGGFPTGQAAYFGEQVRGFGFLHDGSIDTVHHFIGLTLFAARPAGVTSPRDPGNPLGLQTFLPALADRAACALEFRQVSPAQLVGLPAALGLCRESSGVPDLCFLEPADPACTRALSELSVERGDPTFVTTFLRSVRSMCFQLGSMLEGGSAGGACFPEGLRERADMESLVMAFDTNLKPMVGQQVTLHAESGGTAPLLALMLEAAARGDCDVAARQGERGYLMTRPRGLAPGESELVDSRGRNRRLGQLLMRREPITLTCYPPQPDRAEARRSALAR